MADKYTKVNTTPDKTTISKDGKQATFNIKLQGTKKKNWFQRLFNL
jgi:hypothetical protein